MRHLIASLFLVLAAAPTSIMSSGCGPTQRPDGGQGLLAVGSPSPRLSDTTHGGKTITIGAADSPITLVYFYPKDATPGCTREACAFRNAWDRFEKANVIIVGVSGDDDSSHQSFSAEHRLPFPLVSDTDGAWATAFGVPTTAGMPKRVSFLIDGSGNVAKVNADVDPGLHADEVLSDVADLGSRSPYPSRTGQSDSFHCDTSVTV